MNLPDLRRALWVCLLLPACARSTPATLDAAGGPGDAGAIDASTDAMVAQAPRPGAELVSTGGQVRAGSVTMDVELGHWVEQSEVSVGTRRLVGAAVVYP